MTSTSATSHASRELAVRPRCSGVNLAGGREEAKYRRWVVSPQPALRVVYLCCMPSRRPVMRTYVTNAITAGKWEKGLTYRTAVVAVSSYLVCTGQAH